MEGLSKGVTSYDFTLIKYLYGYGVGSKEETQGVIHMRGDVDIG